ncbi:helix-turn-helix domain-containing protein [Variovorax sp. PAMC26660]|uniref:MmyB family transcriptional regulator n=1 Tax=Variovorax sp. PAMC26660 TaxID=2762322 RepID=UPI00164EB597|nr:helix-turn-helix domain-containing protein [Variovorax sp. PAMC26660]QNK70343.1 helix-turn-helix domain-containing protein [Variovorax sp. PAMC26660]
MKLAQLLRHLRTDRKISQLELSLRLDVSQRHVSYIEAGRARPSRELLLAWLAELEVPTSVRNAALLHAGFALPQEKMALDSPELAPALQALRRTLAAHDPNPALVFDADWRTVDQNRGATWLWSLVMPELAASAGCQVRGMDMITALGHPKGLLSRMHEPWTVGSALLAQLHTEASATPALQARIQRLSEALTQRHKPAEGSTSQPGHAAPYLSFTFDTALGTLSYFYVQSVFALPQDVTLASLRMELWFPLDSHTAEVSRRHVSLN